MDAIDSHELTIQLQFHSFKSHSISLLDGPTNHSPSTLDIPLLHLSEAVPTPSSGGFELVVDILKLVRKRLGILYDQSSKVLIPVPTAEIIPEYPKKLIERMDCSNNNSPESSPCIDLPSETGVTTPSPPMTPVSSPVPSPPPSNSGFIEPVANEMEIDTQPTVVLSQENAFADKKKRKRKKVKRLGLKKANKRVQAKPFAIIQKPKKANEKVQCPTCKKWVTNSKLLQRHIKTVHDIKDFGDINDKIKCDFCDALFNAKASVTRHCREIHPNEMIPTKNSPQKDNNPPKD